MPFGVEVMGRVRELGTIDDVLAIASQVDFVRPVLDFAHMHATSDGAFTDVDAFASALEATDDVIEPGAPFHIHFSDIAYANRNETKHLPYGEGTLRAEPLRDALARFERPATVISESPDPEVDSGDPGGADRPELGAPLFVRRRFIVTAARAEEIGEMAQRPVLERTQPVVIERLDRLAHEHLRLFVAPLAAANDAERELRRPDRDAIVRPDRLARLERVPLGLVELALVSEHHRKRALRLAQTAAVAEALQRAYRFALSSRLGQSGHWNACGHGHHAIGLRVVHEDPPGVR